MCVCGEHTDGEYYTCKWVIAFLLMTLNIQTAFCWTHYLFRSEDLSAITIRLTLKQLSLSVSVCVCVCVCVCVRVFKLNVLGGQISWKVSSDVDKNLTYISHTDNCKHDFWSKKKYFVYKNVHTCARSNFSWDHGDPAACGKRRIMNRV